MTLGPVQFIAVSVDSLDGLRGRVIEELDALTPTDAVRILDVLFVAKDDAGDLLALEISELTDELGDELLGMILGQLLGFSFEGPPDELDPFTDGFGGSALGVSQSDIERIGDSLPPDSAAILLLVEHRWAIGMRQAILDTGGQIAAMGFLNPDALALVGAELVATALAVDALEAELYPGD
jgi:hypothetical protein